MSQPVVGKNVDSWCARCKMMLAHTIEAVVKNKITRTHCNTCGGQHAYRPNPPGTAAARRAGGGARTVKAVAPPFDYERLLQGRDLSRARAYMAGERFERQEVIHHPSFGVGVVVALRDSNKIDVGFRDGMKTLAHGTTLR
jgi:hypothetical protein